MPKQATVLKYLNLKSVEDGTYIYLYRIYKDEFSMEKCLSNTKDERLKDKADICAAFGRVGRFDENGELFDKYNVAFYEGEIYSRGGVISIWFSKPDKRKAKKVLRKFYKERIATTEAKLARYNKHLELLK